MFDKRLKMPKMPKSPGSPAKNTAARKEDKAPAEPLKKGNLRATAGTKMREQTGATRKKTEPDNPVKPVKVKAPSGAVRKRLEGKLL